MRLLTWVPVLLTSMVLAGCADGVSPASSNDGAGSDRVADACDHLRDAAAEYAASDASESEFMTFVTALGYAVEGVQDSGDSALLAAADRMERATLAGSYDAIADSLPEFISACTGH